MVMNYDTKKILKQIKEHRGRFCVLSLCCTPLCYTAKKFFGKDIRQLKAIEKDT